MIEVAWAGPNQPDARDAMARWAAEHIWTGQGREFGECVCMGVLDAGKPIAVIVFHDYEPLAGIIEFSGAATDRKWLQRHVLQAMFDYPFKDIGCQMVVTRNSAAKRQRHLHRMLKSYGFKPHRIPRLFGRKEDGIVHTLTDDDWRKNKFNRKHVDGQTEGTRAA